MSTTNQQQHIRTALHIDPLEYNRLESQHQDEDSATYLRSLGINPETFDLDAE